jgi:FtsP/CotA-like multicopper oxidase with cupredoxin domain
MPFKVSAGKRYQTSAIHFARDPQSLQLVGHEVELLGIAGQQTAGVRKDVLTLPGFTRVEFEFVAQTNELFLLHSQQVLLRESFLRRG